MDPYLLTGAVLVLGTGLLFKMQKHLTWLQLIQVCLLAFVPYLLLFNSLKNSNENKIQTEQMEVLGNIRQGITRQVDSNFSLIAGLTAHISAIPDITPEQFERFAKAVFKLNPGIKNLAAAPDMVIKMIYPYEGNEAALGLNYLEKEFQRDAAIEARDARGKIVVTGIVNLVQGGRGLIGRQAVMIDDPNNQGSQRFWGLVSTVIDFDQLIQKSGVVELQKKYLFALYPPSKFPKIVEPIVGSTKASEHPLRSVNYFTIGDSTWIMVVSPKHDALQFAHDNWGLLIFPFVLALALLWVYRYRNQQTTTNDAYQRTIVEKEQLLNAAGELARIGAWKLNATGQLYYLNSSTEKILGLPHNCQDPKLDDILCNFVESDGILLKSLIQDSFKRGQPLDAEFKLVTKDADSWIRILGTPIKENNQVVEILGAVQDITARKNLIESIQRQSIYDAVTGLPNRFLFLDRLKKTVFQAERTNLKFALLFIDLDDFKSVNDNYGHSAGDSLLHAVAGRIKHCLRQTDTLARYSGDEFTAILPNIGKDTLPVSVAEKILDAMSKPFQINNSLIYCGASIGIALYPNDGDQPEKLISSADHAMYEAKRTGRNSWHFFTEEMQRESERRHLIFNQLTAAISEQRLNVYYQPIVDIYSKKTLKCETLVRWFENNKQVPTTEFISLAEEWGMINTIDIMVLEKAGNKFLDMHQQGMPIPALSVNLSPKMFTSRDGSLSRWISTLESFLPRLSITVEITERLLIQDSEQAMQVLSKLKDMGAHIAIDDFGTGYSSLSYLSNFPIDCLKLDKSFICKLAIDPKAEMLTDSIIMLAQKMGLEVIAEGIEEEQQLEILKKLGCQLGQGYYFTKPLSAESLVDYINYSTDAWIG